MQRAIESFCGEPKYGFKHPYQAAHKRHEPVSTDDLTPSSDVCTLACQQRHNYKNENKKYKKNIFIDNGFQLKNQEV